MERFSGDRRYGDPRRRVLAPDLEIDVKCAAEADVPVLISADDDVALWIARLIHGRSRRARAPFTVVPAELADGAAALGILRILERHARDEDAGTVFISHICDASPLVQAELKRWLEERVVGWLFPRVLASARHLADRVAAGRFDETLYYYLNMIHIQVNGPGERHRSRAPGDGEDEESAESSRSMLTG